jgi:putative flippase GtrA
MKILLVLMIVCSVIGGFSINGTWSFLYQFEFIDFPRLLSAEGQSILGIIAWVLILIAHCGIVALPFITGENYFRPVLIFAPLLFIVSFIAIATIFVLLFLVSFIIVWIIALIIGRNREPSRA